MPVQTELSQHHRLTPSEQDVMRLVAFGLSDDEIASSLGLAVRTLQSRLYRLHARTGLRGRRIVSWGVVHLAYCVRRTA